MKKVLLPIAIAIMLLYIGADFVDSNEREVPPQKQKIAIPTPVQITDGGRVVADRDQWDPNKGFSIIYVYIENGSLEDVVSSGYEPGLSLYNKKNAR